MGGIGDVRKRVDLALPTGGSGKNTLTSSMNARNGSGCTIRGHRDQPWGISSSETGSFVMSAPARVLSSICRYLRSEKNVMSDGPASARDESPLSSTEPSPPNGDQLTADLDCELVGTQRTFRAQGGETFGDRARVDRSIRIRQKRCGAKWLSPQALKQVTGPASFDKLIWVWLFWNRENRPFSQ